MTCDRLAQRYGGRPSDYLSSEPEALAFDLLCLREAQRQQRAMARKGGLTATMET